MSRPIFIPLISAAAFLALSACSKPSPEASTPAADLPTASVRTTTVRAVTAMRFQDVAGTVRPRDYATLSPKVMGTVIQVNADLGQTVAAGEVLVKISANEIAAKVSQAETALSQAQRDLDRETALLTQGASTAEMVRNLADRQRIMSAQVDEARTLLTYTRITAPFDGVITHKMVNEGNLAAPGQPLLELEGTGTFRVETELPESLADLNPGTPLTVRLGPTNVTGQLAEISPASDRMSRTVLAKIDLPGGITARSGQYVRVAVPIGSADALLIPAAALSRFGQMERVFVATEGHADLRLIKTGSHRGEDIEVLSGLSAGESVIISDSTNLREGQALSIQP